eukprot:9163012-Prorocentrum_lima.AAC.1
MTKGPNGRNLLWREGPTAGIIRACTPRTAALTRRGRRSSGRRVPRKGGAWEACLAASLDRHQEAVLTGEEA